MATEDIVGKTIGELEELTELSGNEMIPIEIGGENKRIKTSLLVTKAELGDINTILDTINGEVI